MEDGFRQGGKGFVEEFFVRTFKFGVAVVPKGRGSEVEAVEPCERRGPGRVGKQML